jgi:hypothetical protein
MLLEFDFGVFCRHGLECLRELGHLAIVGFVVIGEVGIDVLFVTEAESVSRDNLLPERLIPQHSSGVVSTLGLLVGIGSAEVGDVIEENLLRVLQVVLNSAEAIEGEFDAVAVQADGVEACDELRVLETHGIFCVAHLVE